MYKPCQYLGKINYYNTEARSTMRNIIMKVETLCPFDDEGKGKQNFPNVDYSSWHKHYVLHFPNHLEQEANDYII